MCVSLYARSCLVSSPSAPSGGKGIPLMLPCLPGESSIAVACIMLNLLVSCACWSSSPGAGAPCTPRGLPAWTSPLSHGAVWYSPLSRCSRIIAAAVMSSSIRCLFRGWCLVAWFSPPQLRMASAGGVWWSLSHLRLLVMAACRFE